MVQHGSQRSAKSFYNLHMGPIRFRGQTLTVYIRAGYLERFDAAKRENTICAETRGRRDYHMVALKEASRDFDLGPKATMEKSLGDDFVGIPADVRCTHLGSTT